MLKACLNGARMPHEHPRLPVTPEQLAADARAAREEGADGIHLHVKDAGGRDTFDADALDASLTAVRAAVPGMPLGVTTGAWALPDPADRVGAIRAWRQLPDFASVNWHEEGADDVAAALLERGVGVEAGLWTLDAVHAWLASPRRPQCLRVLLELPDDPDQERVLDQADRMLDALRAAGEDGIPVLHGEGASAWPVLRRAAERNLDSRIGLEDALTLPDGATAQDNAALVRAAAELLR